MSKCLNNASYNIGSDDQMPTLPFNKLKLHEKSKFNQLKIIFIIASSVFDIRLHLLSKCLNKASYNIVSDDQMPTLPLVLHRQ